MRLFLAILFAVGGLAQEVIVSNLPQVNPTTTLYHWTSGVLDYSCEARAVQPAAAITVSGFSNANPGVATATSHGYFFASGTTQKLLVWISGATSGWTGINGAHVLIPTSANAMSIDVDTTAFGSFSGQTIVVTTRAPRAASSVWSVKSYVSDSSGQLTIASWAANLSAVTSLATLGSATTSFTLPCAAPGAFQ